MPEARPLTLLTTSSHLSDEELVARFAAGDVGAATEVWNRYAVVVRQVLRRTLGRMDVDDQVQEVFVALARSIGNLRDRKALKSFAIGIAVHVARSSLRFTRVRRFFGLGRGEEVPEPAAPEVDHEGREACERLNAILAQLDTESRLAFVLRYVEELELAEIATALDCSLATAKRRVRHAEERVHLLAAREPALKRYVQEVEDVSETS